MHMFEKLRFWKKDKPLAWVQNFSHWVGYSGASFEEHSALNLSAVWACVRLVSQTAASLPLQLRHYQRGNLVPLPESHYLVRLLKLSPNSQQTPFKMIEFLVSSLLLRGNAYFEKVYLGKKLVSLKPMLPNRVSIQCSGDGKVVYVVAEELGRSRQLKADQVWHISGFGNGFGTSAHLGLDALNVGANVFRHAKAADAIASKVFESGMSLSGVLTVENTFLKPEQRKQLQESLKQYAGSDNAGKIMLLEAGLKYQGISLNPEAAQLLESRSYGVEEICRFFGVPPILIGHGGKNSSWGSSIEGVSQLFVRHTLNPLLTNIEQSIAANLVGADEVAWIRVNFDVDELLRGDMAARATLYSSFVNNGIMSRNEVREKENLPRRPEADALTAQSAHIPVEDIGKNYD